MRRHLLLGMMFAALVGCATQQDAKNLPHDGSSMARAIYVTSAAEEADVLKKWCPDCEFIKRNIIQDDNGNQYEKVRMREPNGKERWYWFDISQMQ